MIKSQSISFAVCCCVALASCSDEPRLDEHKVATDSLESFFASWEDDPLVLATSQSLAFVPWCQDINNEILDDVFIVGKWIPEHVLLHLETEAPELLDFDKLRWSRELIERNAALVAQRLHYDFVRSQLPGSDFAAMTRIESRSERNERVAAFIKERTGDTFPSPFCSNLEQRLELVRDKAIALRIEQSQQNLNTEHD